MRNEELAAVRAGARIRHGQLAGCVMFQLGGALVLEAVAGPSRSVSVRASALDHEVGNDPVKRQPVVIAAFCQIEEIRYCYWRIRRK